VRLRLDAQEGLLRRLVRRPLRLRRGGQQAEQRRREREAAQQAAPAGHVRSATARSPSPARALRGLDALGEAVAAGDVGRGELAEFAILPAPADTGAGLPSPRTPTAEAGT